MTRVTTVGAWEERPLPPLPPPLPLALPLPTNRTVRPAANSLARTEDSAAPSKGEPHMVHAVATSAKGCSTREDDEPRPLPPWPSADAEAEAAEAATVIQSLLSFTNGCR
jgi:hypothetical protein